MKNLKKLLFVFLFGLFMIPTCVFADEIDTDSIVKRLAPDLENATFYMKKPTSMEEEDFNLNGYLAKTLEGDNYNVYGYCMGPDYEECEVEFTSLDYTNNCVWSNEQNGLVCNTTGWKHSYHLNATFVDPTSNSAITAFMSQLNNFNMTDPTTYYIIEDLSLINYYATSKKSELWQKGAPGRALKYSSLNQLSKGSNVYYYLDVRAGNQDETLMFESAFGPMSIFYGAYSYGAKEQGVYLRRVLYIPSSTEDSPAAFAAAAQKRIRDYLGDNTVTVTDGGLLTSLPAGSEDDVYPVANNDGHYYNVTVAERTYKFYVVKGTAEQLVEPTYAGLDLDSKIEVSGGDSSVPLDAEVSVDYVEDATLKDKIGTDQYKSYDITLYSSAKGTQIEHSVNGKFIVKIPVPEEFAGKTLKVYYVPNEGEPEIHEVTPQKINGIDYAVFETDHFSVYTLAVASTDNPQTFDKIIIYLSILGASILGIVLTGLYLKKKVFHE